MALLILENQQEERKQQLTRQLVNNSLTLGEQPKVRSWMNPEVASHYMKFACGCYGWPMYVFKSPLASLGLMKVLTRGRSVDHITHKILLKLVDKLCVLFMLNPLLINDINLIERSCATLQNRFMLGWTNKFYLLVVAQPFIKG